jgi:hypothetical protein
MLSPRKFFRRLVEVAILLLLYNIIGIAATGGWGTPFYMVKEQYGRVLTKVNGVREVKTDAGIFPRITVLDPTKWIFNTKEYSMRVEYIYLDNDSKPHEMQAADKVKFYGAGVWTYKIIDLYKFGVRMGENALEMLTAELNGIAKAVIQSYPVETTVTNIDYINYQVNNCADVKKIEEKYGIKIDSFRLMHATYPQELNEGTAAAKKIQIVSEALKKAAPNIASSKETLAKADEYRLRQLIIGSGVTTEEGKQKALETLKDLTLYEMLEKRPAGETVYVIPYGNAPTMTLPSAAQKNKSQSTHDTKSESNWMIGEPSANP